MAATPDAVPAARVFAEEQDVGDILSGQAFRGCYPLDHIGERPCKVDHQLFEPPGDPKRRDPGDDLAYRGVAALIVHLRFHARHPHGQDSDTAAGDWGGIDSVATPRPDRDRKARRRLLLVIDVEPASRLARIEIDGTHLGVDVVVTRRRCQRRIVAGVIKR